MEFPLTFRNFCVDALVVDPSGKADVEVLFYNVTSDVAYITETDTGIIFTLWSRLC